MITLTKMEKKVLKALIESAKGNGYDFGFIEDARGVVPRASLCGVVASLSTKGILTVFPTEDFGGGPCTQVYINGVSQGSIDDNDYSRETRDIKLSELHKACE